MTTQRVSHSTIALFLISIVSLCYLNILNHDLFLDDLDWIIGNAYIKDWRYWPKMFTENLLGGAGKSSDYYRPAIQIMYALGYHLWELNPMGYHLISIFYHALATVCLYLFLDQILNRKIALITALLFGLHPLQTEAVDIPSGLGIPMGMSFLLLTLLAYLKIKTLSAGWLKWGLRIAALATTAIALLAKETMVVLPGYIFLTEFYFFRMNEEKWARFKNSLLAALPYLLVVLLYVALRFTVLNFGGTGNLYRQSNVFTEHMSVRFFTFMTVLVKYGELMIWPAALHMERGTVMPVYLSLWHVPVLFGFILFVGLLAASWVCTFKKPVPALPWSLARVAPFGILWFFFGLVPVCNILIPINSIMVESWIYAPLAGAILIFVVLLTGCLEKYGNFARVAFFTLLITACGLRTIQQNRVWANAVTFYEHTLQHAPRSSSFRNNLAMAYAEKNRLQDAIHHYRLAIQINDQYSETHHNLANVYQGLGQWAEAEKEFYRAIEMNPQFFQSYSALFALYYKLNKPAAAQAIAERLIQNVPWRWEGYYYLGNLYAIQGDRAQAIALWRKGLSMDPYNKILQDLLSSPPEVK